MKTILVVDDHRLIYDGLVKLLGDSYLLEYASTTQDALTMLSSSEYYAVILDITIGKQKGFDVIHAIPMAVPVFFLSMHKSAAFIQMALKCKAKGYFLKDEPMDLLKNALQRHHERSFWMSPTVEQELNNASEYESSNYDKLTPREQQIFAMLAEDLGYKEIASRLHLSTKTVNNHRDHLMKKLGVDTQTGLVREALKLGIISVE